MGSTPKKDQALENIAVLATSGKFSLALAQIFLGDYESVEKIFSRE